jgi:hypothetical protein
VKKLTLDFNERQEEEEFQDLYGGVSDANSESSQYYLLKYI